MIYFQSLNMYHMNNMKMLYLIHASMIVMNQYFGKFLPIN